MFRANPARARAAVAMQEDALMRNPYSEEQFRRYLGGPFVAGLVRTAPSIAIEAAPRLAGQAAGAVGQAAGAVGQAVGQAAQRAAIEVPKLARAAGAAVGRAYDRFQEGQQRRQFVQERMGPDPAEGFEGRVMQSPVVEELRQQRLARDAETELRLEAGRQRAEQMRLDKEAKDAEFARGREAGAQRAAQMRFDALAKEEAFRQGREAGAERAKQMERARIAQEYRDRLEAFHRGRDAVRAQADAENLARVQAEARARAPPPPPAPRAPARFIPSPAPQAQARQGARGALAPAGGTFEDFLAGTFN
jgi:hypothetical protein